jgi:hypothetical protein
VPTCKISKLHELLIHSTIHASMQTMHMPIYKVVHACALNTDDTDPGFALPITMWFTWQMQACGPLESFLLDQSTLSMKLFRIGVGSRKRLKCAANSCSTRSWRDGWHSNSEHITTKAWSKPEHKDHCLKSRDALGVAPELPCQGHGLARHRTLVL